MKVLEVSEEGEGGEVGTLAADYVVALHDVAVLYTDEHQCYFNTSGVYSIPHSHFRKRLLYSIFLRIFRYTLTEKNFLRPSSKIKKYIFSSRRFPVSKDILSDVLPFR